MAAVRGGQPFHAVTDSFRNRLLDDFSVEATPLQWQTLSQPSWLPADSRIYLPALPRSSVGATAAACASIRAHGCQPIPHLAARAMRNRIALAEWLQRMQEAGARSLLLIAGDRARPAGPFPHTLAVLDSGLVERFGFCGIGVAGHPEGHPKAGEGEVLEALRRKAAWADENGRAAWIVSQFAFAAEPVMRWLRDLHANGIGLPVHVGVPGPAKVATLARFAAQCGIGPSARMLMRRPGAVSRLLGRWSPGAMLETLAQDLARHPELPVPGLHVFPFGGLDRSIEYFLSLQSDAVRRQVATGSG